MKDQFDDEAEKMVKSALIESCGDWTILNAKADEISKSLKLAELLRNKARLDWIRCKNLNAIIKVIYDNCDGLTLRQAIDAAIKEEKK